MSSIRLRLLIILVGLFSLVWILITAASYSLARHEIEELFDAQLAQYARTLQGVALHELKENEHEDIELSDSFFGHSYEKKVAFQVWNGKVLVMHSGVAPATRMSDVFGFTDQSFNDEVWRVFVLPSMDGIASVQVAEQYDVRNELVDAISLQVLYPLFIALPLLAGMIWFAVGRGLRPLQRVTAEVAIRSPKVLQPLPLDYAPAEIEPLIVAINQLMAQLHRALENEHRFTSDAAHELRTPLAILKVQAQVAQAARNDLERVDAIENILKGVDRATSLVEQLLTMARLDPKSNKNEFESVDLVSVAARVISEFAQIALDKDIDLGLEDDCSGTLPGYPDALGVLLRNLVDNALKYTPSGGRVDVAVRQTKLGIKLSVTDSGPGIVPELQDRVFDRFYRITGNQAVGCGLGLSIVQRIAELHQAHIAIDQDMLPGFRVTVTFPSCPA